MKHINISTNGIHTLIAKGGQTGGHINKILIANTHGTVPITVSLYFDDGSSPVNPFYIIREVEMPVNTTMVLEDNLRFDYKKTSLKFGIAGGSPSTATIIIS